MSKQHAKVQKEQVRRRRKRLFRYALLEKRALSRSFLMNLLSTLSDLAGPFIISLLLNALVRDGVASAVRRLPTYLIGYAVLTFLNAYSRYASDISAVGAAAKISSRVRDELFRHIQKLPIADFDRLPSGKIVSRVTNDCKTLQNLYRIVLSNLVLGALYVLFCFGALLSLDLRLGLLLTPSLLLLIVVIQDYRQKTSVYDRGLRRSISELSANVNENLQNVQFIQALALEENVLDSFNARNRRLFHFNMKLTLLEAYSAFNIVGIIRNGSIAAVLILFGLGWLNGWSFLPLGYLYLFIDYIQKIFVRMHDVSNQLNQLERAHSAADHIFEIMDLPTEAEAAELGGTYEAPPASPAVFVGSSGEVGAAGAASKLSEEALLTVQNVSFAYPVGAEVLHDVSFTLHQGETVAIVGDTGSGKSTLINLLLRFYEIRKGSIRIRGKDIRSLERSDLRRHFALVQQDAYLFNGTLEANIRMGNPNVGRDDARNALIRLGAEELLKHRDGLDRLVIQNGQDLSSGERQLLTFARALAQEPDILILDEATSHVDTETERIVQQATAKLLEGRSSIMIAHRLSTIRHADEILVLRKGRIVERGRHEELMAKGGFYRRMVELQTAGGIEDASEL